MSSSLQIWDTARSREMPGPPKKTSVAPMKLHCRTCLSTMGQDYQHIPYLLFPPLKRYRRKVYLTFFRLINTSSLWPRSALLCLHVFCSPIHRWPVFQTYSVSGVPANILYTTWSSHRPTIVSAEAKAPGPGGRWQRGPSPCQEPAHLLLLS